MSLAPRIPRLPKAAAIKLTTIAMEADEARVLANSTKDKLAKATDAFQLMGRSSGVQVGEIDTLRDAQNRHQDRQRLLSDLHGRITRYLEGLSDTTPINAYVRERELATKGAPSDAVMRLRVEIGQLKAALFATKRAPLPIADQKQELRKHVESLAREGKPTLSITADGVSVLPTGSTHDQTLTPQRLMKWEAWKDPERFLSKLEATLPRDEHPNAMSKQDRDAKVRELTKKLLLCERDEEAVIVRAKQDGIEIARRADADPQAVLGIVVHAYGSMAAA